MEECKQVLVYGTSLNMAVIAASLRADSTLKVVSIDNKSPITQQNLDETDLAAIVFDLSDTAHGMNLRLLRNRPELLLIGVDPARDEIRIFSSRSVQALSISALVNVIHHKDSNSQNAKEGKSEFHINHGVGDEK